MHGAIKYLLHMFRLMHIKIFLFKIFFKFCVFKVYNGENKPLAEALKNMFT